MIDEAAREREALRRRGERGQLQLQAFDEIARADTDRVELLHQQQDTLDLFLVMKRRADWSMVGKVEGDLGEGLPHPAHGGNLRPQHCPQRQHPRVCPRQQGGLSSRASDVISISQ